MNSLPDVVEYLDSLPFKRYVGLPEKAGDIVDADVTIVAPGV